MEQPYVGILIALLLMFENTYGWVLPVLLLVFQNPMLELVQTVAGLTGVGITIALLVIVSSATEVIR